MNFLGVGPLEVALVAIVAVIVLGPERIPGVAVQLARAVRYMRGYATDATADIRKELQERRRRLIICSVAVVIGLAISAAFTDDLLRFLKHPAEERSQDFRLVFLEPFESFVTYFKIAQMGSIILAMPVIMYQILAFIAPGLRPNEKR